MCSVTRGTNTKLRYVSGIHQMIFPFNNPGIAIWYFESRKMKSHLCLHWSWKSTNDVQGNSQSS
jgi:hypothetical protein